LGGDDNTYEWVANGVTPEKENLQNLPPEVCATWYRNFSEDKNTIIENLEDIREDDPLLYETLKPQGINSLVVVPLYIDKKAVGFYGIDNPPKGLLGYASNMLSIVGYFIVSSLKRRDLLKHLEKLSYLDSLTGLGNRFAKDEYIDNVKCDESIGVVYCDITGLKRTNDTEGHEAGDRLILRACKELKKVFVGYGLFRIGGDEFLVLCPKIEKEMLEQKVEILREALLQNAVNMAIGMYWVENFESRRSIKELSLEAEKLMYEDKIAYYEAQKERKEG
ncbi:MAG: diguanylate cyclase domain-containing protein, partial [Acetivibrio ethanolgignens]